MSDELQQILFLTKSPIKCVKCKHSKFVEAMSVILAFDFFEPHFKFLAILFESLDLLQKVVAMHGIHCDVLCQRLLVQILEKSNIVAFVVHELEQIRG